MAQSWCLTAGAGAAEMTNLMGSRRSLPEVWPNWSCLRFDQCHGDFSMIWQIPAVSILDLPATSARCATSSFLWNASCVDLGDLLGCCPAQLQTSGGTFLACCACVRGWSTLWCCDYWWNEQIDLSWTQAVDLMSKRRLARGRRSGTHGDVRVVLAARLRDWWSYGSRKCPATNSQSSSFDLHMLKNTPFKKYKVWILLSATVQTWDSS